MTGFGHPPSGRGYGPPPGGGSGPPGGGFGPPPGGSPGGYEPPAPQTTPSGLALGAIVLAAMSFVSCGLFASLPAVIMAKVELGKIARGESHPANASITKVAFWLAVANLGLTLLTILGVFAYLALIAFAVGLVGISG